MARPIWSGTLSFGLVNVSVSLYSATQDRSPHFNQFQRGTSDRIRYRRVNERTGDEVDYDDIVRGAEVDKNEYVLFEPDELESVAPGRSRSLEISEFVAEDEIDPVLYQKSYYLGPRREDDQKVYGLLLAALAEQRRVAVGTFVLRSKEYLALVRPDGPVLTLSTLYFDDEVRDAGKTVGDLPDPDDVDGKQLRMAEDLIEAMADDWDPSRYHDTYRERVDELVEAKRSGSEVVGESEPPEDTKVVDLMSALRASVERSSGKGAGSKRSGSKRSGGQPSGGKRSGGRGSGGTRSGGRGSGRGGSSRSRGGSGASRRGGDGALSDLNTGELRKLARELDVPGRSTMRRDELIATVGKARRRAS
ncbi:Ku protein [Actinocatenispora sera]|uniref:non-homologous end joining protein Ku n=1 Tax=Actinocatenispora sera TaxID=390989 RepID=UPI0033DA7E64